MISNLPSWINLLFLFTLLLTLILFYHANGKSQKALLLILAWSAVQGVLAYFGFYKDTESIPPRFVLVLLPATIGIIWGLGRTRIEWLSNNRNPLLSTLTHLVRLPVEIVLLQLFLHQMVPELMTFEGVNFDILMGITAPIAALLLWKKKLKRPVLIAWNIIGLLLVLNILTIGILSAELPFQRLAFDQPNKGITYFPFVLLPATIVPIVVWTHFSDLILLIRNPG